MRDAGLLAAAAVLWLTACAGPGRAPAGSLVGARVYAETPVGRARRALDLALVRSDREAALAARLRLGEALLRAGELEEGRYHLVQVKEGGKPPAARRARMLLAWSYAVAGREDLARAYLRGIPPGAVRPPWRRALAELLGRAARAASTAPAPGVTVRPRSRWGAAPVRTELAVPMERVRRITVHHSGVLTWDPSLPAAVAALRAIQRDHFHRGWADMGYHYVIDRAGRVWEGRPLRFQGAHAGNHRLNRGNIGVCLLGDFSREEPTAAQLAALQRLLDALRRRYGVPLGAVLPHGSLRPTDCPGAHLRRWLEGYRRRAQGGRRYRVAPGDTLAAIARRYGVPLRRLLEANPGKAARLRPGDWVVIP